jgi:phosphoribosylformylglycinamidine synthase PurS subunit
VKYEVLVELKSDVLDPEGRAIEESLVRLGCGVKNLRVSKRYVFELDKPDDALAQKVASEHLANPISQVFEVRKL